MRTLILGALFAFGCTGPTLENVQIDPACEGAICLAWEECRAGACYCKTDAPDGAQCESVDGGNTTK